MTRNEKLEAAVRSLIEQAALLDYRTFATGERVQVVTIPGPAMVAVNDAFNMPPDPQPVVQRPGIADDNDGMPVDLPDAADISIATAPPGTRFEWWNGASWVERSVQINGKLEVHDENGVCGTPDKTIYCPAQVRNVRLPQAAVKPASTTPAELEKVANRLIQLYDSDDEVRDIVDTIRRYLPIGEARMAAEELCACVHDSNTSWTSTVVKADKCRVALKDEPKAKMNSVEHADYERLKQRVVELEAMHAGRTAKDWHGSWVAAIKERDGLRANLAAVEKMNTALATERDDDRQLPAQALERIKALESESKDTPLYAERSAQEWYHSCKKIYAEGNHDRQLLAQALKKIKALESRLATLLPVVTNTAQALRDFWPTVGDDWAKKYNLPESSWTDQFEMLASRLEAAAKETP